MKDFYTYPAIFNYAEDGISIEFPDLPGCLSCADTDEEAFKNAREALALYISSLEDEGQIIPIPTPVSKIILLENQIATLIEVWMPVYRDQIKVVSVRKSLTIPQWLNKMAEKNKINFSQVLQSALKEQLGIKERH